MNRYIKAMEIGLANEENGISYVDLVKQLQKDLDYKFGYSAELTFMEWFDENFTNDIRNLDYEVNKSKLRHYQSKRDNATINDDQRENAKAIEEVLYNKFFLNGLASKQYLDYLELQESRRSASKAQQASKTAINIAICAFAVNVVLGFISLWQSLMPKPLDVKIIEDKTAVRHLQEDMKQLEASKFSRRE